MLSIEKRTCGRTSVIVVLYDEMTMEHFLSQPENCEDTYGDPLASSELILEGQVRINQKS